MSAPSGEVCIVRHEPEENEADDCVNEKGKHGRFRLRLSKKSSKSESESSIFESGVGIGKPYNICQPQAAWCVSFDMSQDVIEVNDCVD